MRDKGDLSHHTWNSYANVCNQLLGFFGEDRLLADILPKDFEKLSAKWALTCGPVRLSAEINRARVVFAALYRAGTVQQAETALPTIPLAASS